MIKSSFLPKSHFQKACGNATQLFIIATFFRLRSATLCWNLTFVEFNNGREYFIVFFIPF